MKKVVDQNQKCRKNPVIELSALWHRRGYGAMVARLTPDQKVGSSNLSGLMSQLFLFFHDDNDLIANS